MGNQTTPIDLPYYPLTIQSSGTNDNIIIGLLVGLLVGVGTLVLLTGAIMASVLLKKAKRPDDTNTRDGHDPLPNNNVDDTKRSMDPHHPKPSNAPYVVHYAPPGMHPAHQDHNAAEIHSGPGGAPRALTPVQREAPTALSRPTPPPPIGAWHYGPNDGG